MHRSIHAKRGEMESIVHQHGGEVFLAVMVDVDEEIDFVFGKHHRDDELQIMIVLTQSAVSLSSTLRRPSVSRKGEGCLDEKK